MNQPDEKERNEIINKIIHILSRFGSRSTPIHLSEYLTKEREVSGQKSEAEYQKEQKEWLENVKSRKKSMLPR